MDNVQSKVALVWSRCAQCVPVDLGFRDAESIADFQDPLPSFPAIVYKNYCDCGPGNRHPSQNLPKKSNHLRASELLPAGTAAAANKKISSPVSSASSTGSGSHSRNQGDEHASDFSESNLFRNSSGDGPHSANSILSSAARKPQSSAENETCDGATRDNNNNNTPQGTAALRLRSNRLVSLVGFGQLLTRMQLPSAACLQWLDLSFNRFTTFDEALSDCLGLTHLYLHSNLIEDVREIQTRLRAMPFAPQLLTLTLHGNPIVAHPECKAYVLRACPRLRHLDFGGVTRADRRVAHYINSFHSSERKDAR